MACYMLSPPGSDLFFPPPEEQPDRAEPKPRPAKIESGLDCHEPAGLDGDFSPLLAPADLAETA